MPYKDPEIRKTKGRAYTQRYREKKGEPPPGICSCYPACNEPVEEGFKKCKKCREYTQDYRRKHKADRPEGICAGYPACSNPVEEGYKRCKVCRERGSKQIRKPRVRVQVSKRGQEIKAEVFMAYGGKCACCGEERMDLLTIDHIDGYDGTGPRGGAALYRWLRRNEYPEGFRVLCINCNFSLGHFGYCPHGNGLIGACKTGRPRVQSEEVVERLRKAKHDYNQALKLQVMDAYGGPVCAKCGETHIEFLSIDHIDGSGAEHRRKDPKSQNICIWLRQRNYPPGYQVLCMNCNYGDERRVHRLAG